MIVLRNGISWLHMYQATVKACDELSSSRRETRRRTLPAEVSGGTGGSSQHSPKLQQPRQDLRQSIPEEVTAPVPTTWLSSEPPAGEGAESSDEGSSSDHGVPVPLTPITLEQVALATRKAVASVLCVRNLSTRPEIVEQLDVVKLGLGQVATATIEDTSVEQTAAAALASLDAAVIPLSSFEAGTAAKQAQKDVQDLLVLLCSRFLNPAELRHKGISDNLRERLSSACQRDVSADLDLWSRLGNAKFKLFTPRAKFGRRRPRRTRASRLSTAPAWIKADSSPGSVTERTLVAGAFTNGLGKDIPAAAASGALSSRPHRPVARPALAPPEAAVGPSADTRQPGQRQSDLEEPEPALAPANGGSSSVAKPAGRRQAKREQ